MIDNEEEMELQEEIQRCKLEYLTQIKNRLIELFQEAIQEKIYDISNPDMTWWQRTNDFINSIDFKFESNDSALVYVNVDKLNYFSYVNFQETSNDVSDEIPLLLEFGHHSDKSNQYGMYKDYSGRYYLETALLKMQSEYPDLKFEIVM